MLFIWQWCVCVDFITTECSLMSLNPDVPPSVQFCYVLPFLQCSQRKEQLHTNLPDIADSLKEREERYFKITALLIIKDDKMVWKHCTCHISVQLLWKDVTENGSCWNSHFSWSVRVSSSNSSCIKVFLSKQMLEQFEVCKSSHTYKKNILQLIKYCTSPTRSLLLNRSMPSCQSSAKCFIIQEVLKQKAHKLHKIIITYCLLLQVISFLVYFINWKLTHAESYLWTF